jgi:RimJ/RimL family protein N-acetyltransferase
MHAAIESCERLAGLTGWAVAADWPNDDLVDALPFIVKGLEACPELEAWTRLIVRESDNVVIGELGFKSLPDAAGEAEIGYGVASSHRGRGYATEAVAALCAWAMQEQGLRIVRAECLPDNAGSIGVLRRVGFRESGSDATMLRWILVRA